MILITTDKHGDYLFDKARIIKLEKELTEFHYAYFNHEVQTQASLGEVKKLLKTIEDLYKDLKG